MNPILYIGMDVHKDSISIAIAEAGPQGEVRHFGSILYDFHAIDRLIAKLRKAHGPEIRLSFCYEAGPCGYGLARRLMSLGHQCLIAAPSMIAKKPGDKVKTDRRGEQKNVG